MKAQNSIKIVESFDEILNYLQYGTNIPIMERFHEYILFDFNVFNPISLLLINNGDVAGHTLVFDDDAETLYFGFFGVVGHENIKIEFLINQLKKYARNHNYTSISGPINIPTIIYGWGFMGKNSLDSLYRARPVTPPQYLELFLNQGFSIKTEEISWEGKVPEVDINQLNKDVIDRYKVIDIKNWKELTPYFKDILFLNSRNMPSESVLTPSVEKVAKNYMNFLIHFGEPYMISFLKDSNTDKVIGYISCLPNPFRDDSFCVFTIVIDKEYRDKRLTWLLSGRAFNKARDHGINYMSTPIEKSNEITQINARKVGLSPLRTHLVLEYKL